MQIVQQEAWIKERAYAIWEQEGCPAGREKQHWFQAAGEIESLIALPAVDKAGQRAGKASRSATSAAPKSRSAKARRTAA